MNNPWSSRRKLSTAVCVLSLFTCCSFSFAQESDEEPVAASLDSEQFLSWEHSLTTRTALSSHAAAKVKIFNNWTPQRHRMLVKYNVLGMGAARSWVSENVGPSFSMPDFNAARFTGKGAAYHHGAFGTIERLDDDRVTVFSSEAGTYFTEPRRALMKRLRFDPWKKLAPELSQETPPALTAEQRTRLGREVRSLLRPMMKKVFRAYFRPLPQTRTFNVSGEQLVARGYRMTLLMNAGGESAGAQWIRTNFEWWLAARDGSDDIVQNFVNQSIDDLKEMGGFTSSMWLNEMLPVMWHTMPQEFHQAIATLFQNGVFWSEQPFSIAGTPVYAAMTLIPPPSPYERCPDCGDEHVPAKGKPRSNTIRMELQLTRRSTQRLQAAVFEAPPEYKKDSIEPVLKEYEEGMGAIQSLFDDELRLADARALPGGHGPRQKYSWSAMRNYLRVARSASAGF